MGTTCFLSMWLSNTATAAMLMPIAQAVLMEMDDNRKRRREDPLLATGSVCGSPGSEGVNLVTLHDSVLHSYLMYRHL